jgi:predicted dehydrogenase
VEITAVSDTSITIPNMLKKYLPNLKVYTDYNEMFKDRVVDGVLVTTPSILHYPICKAAAENGIAVFCEKPFTTSPAQAKELSELFESKCLVNQVGYVNRYSAVPNKTKHFIDANVIGKIINIKAEMFSSTIIKPQKGGGWRSKRENGGGVTYEMAAHVLDLLNYIIGKPDKVLDSMLRNVYSENVEDIVNAELIYPGNISCSLFVNWSDKTYRKPMMKLEFFGEKGKIDMDLYGVQVYVDDDIPSEGLIKGWNNIPKILIETPSEYYVRGEGFTYQLYDFAEEIYDCSSKSKCNFNEAYSTQKTIYEIFDHNKLG